jgi:hypothetical protein
MRLSRPQARSGRCDQFIVRLRSGGVFAFLDTMPARRTAAA